MAKVTEKKVTTEVLLDMNDTNVWGITTHQLKDIVNYGVMLHLTPQEIAPYLRCSIKICSEVMDKYMYLRRPIERKLPTPQEWQMDILDLERAVKA